MENVGENVLIEEMLTFQRRSNMLTYEENYLKYRGKCEEMSKELCDNDPSLELVRGHYWCPIDGIEHPHWWCVNVEGEIVDPTKLQFRSMGEGIYVPFNGIVECAECGTKMLEDEANYHGNYAFCSSLCMCKFVGVF